jgi:hypothetical protein
MGMDSYLQLFIQGLQPVGKPGGASAVAFTSTVPGEGASYVTRTFAMELARRTRKNTIIADLETLQKIDIFHYSRVSRHCCKTDVPHLFVLQDVEDEFPDIIEDTRLMPKSSDSEIDRGMGNLQTLRFMFEFILLDCSSLKESGDAALFASAVDGVILVVEAEKTRM